ncbi:glutathione S-transferase family protein [Roseateles amylovorans]|uniref:Glutathione S-transferase family protein n=1 Tax=Roseateles amylovorans TaxID=2978473 RepID=A0ABY6AZS3_9BURK|nr:glutathione S-transferase family protein [Roseateles amylovorans]UXH78413.1 glutathione S-transferase family protein [Roseateles amylovorans]
MQLIGMLDSPYVRRTAIAMLLLGLRFEHRSLSVFRTFDAFSQINPVVKAPTLVCDDGTVLMDSTLILQYAQSLSPGRLLLPPSDPNLRRALRLIGLALAVCDKSVQAVYEQALRPEDKQHEPWLARVTTQLGTALLELEAELKKAPLSAQRDTIGLAGVSIGVAWTFVRQSVPERLPELSRLPTLVAYAQAVEQLPEFRAAPHGDGEVAPVDG